MTRLLLLFGQAAEPTSYTGANAVNGQYGIAGALIVVVGMMLAYMRYRDKEYADIRREQIAADKDLAVSLNGLKEAIVRLDTHIRMAAAVHAPRDQV